MVSGIRRRYIFGQDLTGQEPMFTLLLKNEACEAEYSPNRENWAILLEGADLRRSSLPGVAELGAGGHTLHLPLVSPVPKERVAGWRLELQRMQEALASPTPENVFRAELGLAGIFRFMLDSRADTLAQSPAERLKALIDKDVSFKRSLADLSRACGYSCDHARIVFEQCYHLTPMAYRGQRRLALATELLANTTLSVKEIAKQLGFEHVSAFSAFFHKVSGQTPTSVIHHLRHRM